MPLSRVVGGNAGENFTPRGGNAREIFSPPGSLARENRHQEWREETFLLRVSDGLNLPQEPSSSSPIAPWTCLRPNASRRSSRCGTSITISTIETRGSRARWPRGIHTRSSRPSTRGSGVAAICLGSSVPGQRAHGGYRTRSGLLVAAGKGVVHLLLEDVDEYPEYVEVGIVLTDHVDLEPGFRSWGAAGSTRRSPSRLRPVSPEHFPA